MSLSSTLNPSDLGYDWDFNLRFTVRRFMPSDYHYDSRNICQFAVICWLIWFFDIWNLFLKHLYIRKEYVQVTWTRISNYWSWDSTTSKFKFRELKLFRLDYWYKMIWFVAIALDMIYPHLYMNYAYFLSLMNPCFLL